MHPDTGILQKVLLQNMLYITSNTHHTWFLHIDTLHFLTRVTMSDDFSFRFFNEIRLPYPNVSLLESLLTKPPCQTSTSKQNALLWELYPNACSAVGLVLDRMSVVVGFCAVKNWIENKAGFSVPGVTSCSELFTARWTYSVQGLWEASFHEFLFCASKDFETVLKNITEDYIWSFWWKNLTVFPLYYRWNHLQPKNNSYMFSVSMECKQDVLNVMCTCTAQGSITAWLPCLYTVSAVTSSCALSWKGVTHTAVVMQGFQTRLTIARGCVGSEVTEVDTSDNICERNVCKYKMSWAEVMELSNMVKEKFDTSTW